MKIDLLLPGTLEKRYSERVAPALGALGIKAFTSLKKLIHSGDHLMVWPVRLRRPALGSVLVPSKQGRNYKVGDANVRFPEGFQLEPNKDLMVVDSLYGISAQVSPASDGAERLVEWEDYPMIVVSNGMVTILADILPGKDAFVAVEIWANSLLPLVLLSCRPTVGRDGYGHDVILRWIGSESVRFQLKCQKCEGSGTISCQKCDGIGSFRCKKCGGKGEWQPDGVCRKCGGARGWTCPKCSGSGDFIGRRGDRMGDCGRCHGTGSQTCFVCKGTGEPPILTCNACGGTGTQSCGSCDGKGELPCWDCHGEGMLIVEFLPATGEYRSFGKKIEPNKVSACDTVSGGEYSLHQGAGDFLRRILSDADQSAAERQAIRQLQREIERVDECLEHSIEASGVSRDMLDFKPLRLGRGTTSTRRSKNHHILTFPVFGRPKWARRLEDPIPIDTPLRVLRDKTDGARSVPGDEIDFSTRKRRPLGSAFEARFSGISRDEGNVLFHITFPGDFGPDDLPESIWVLPDFIPPPELAQQRELARWCQRGEAPELLKAFLHDQCAPVAASEIVPFNEGIRSTAAQWEAVNRMMSGHPLVLIKGPPGTGKTTVITEAVLQSIKRNERVLICSQTHQAVANVLEKLHKWGGVRMIRHGRPDNPRLTELEREYLEGGVKQGFLVGVYERVAANQHDFRERLSRLEHLPDMLASAKAAATTLAQQRDDLNRLTADACRLCENNIAAIDRDESSQINGLEKRRNDERQVFDRIKHECATALKKSEHKRDKAQERRAKASATYIKRTGHEPTWVPDLRKDWKLDVSWVMPDRFVDLKLLADRWSRAEDSRKREEQDCWELQGRITQCERDVEACEERIAQDIGQAKDHARAVRETASAQLEKTLEHLRVERKCAEEENFAPQREAVILLRQVDIFENAGEDDSVEAWKLRETETLRLIKLNTEKVTFLDRWNLAVESATGELTTLFWDTTQIFLSTCVGLASWRSFSRHFGKAGVDLVIIDEAAHATLTETLVPLSRAKRAVLIGDEMQLPPALPMELRGRCEGACSARCTIPLRGTGINQFKPPMSRCWLERSAFEWLGETRPSISRVMLNRQFRMHPDIADFVADVFYEGKLENGVVAEQRRISFGEFTKAVCIISTSNYKDRHEEQPDKNSTSYCNSLEVALTKRVLRHARVGLGEDAEFGIITPYKAQRDLMVRELSEFINAGGRINLSAEDIASVDSFQGSERDVMIASFVRSPKKCPRCEGTGKKGDAACSHCNGRGLLGSRLGWVHDLRRLNVAFSRARKMLILIGDINILTHPDYGTDGGANVLMRFRDHVQNRGRVLHLWEEENHE